MEVIIFVVLLIVVCYMIFWIGDINMWTLYVWVEDRSLADIVKGVSTKGCLKYSRHAL